MEPAEKTEDTELVRDNRQSAPRYSVEGDATVVLLQQGVSLACRIVNFSIGGCCIRTQERFRGTATAQVEVAFQVLGLTFRFSGTTQWTDGQHLAGIRFANIPERRKADLLEALAEAEAAKQAAEVKTAAEKTVPAPATSQPASPSAPKPPDQSLAPTLAAQTAASANAKPRPRERREQLRKEVDTSAVIQLINVASRLTGRILDLSLGGCRIRTDERFPVGIYTRVETEFMLEGLPFRLGGVIQTIIDRNTVGIRFLDMSSRKREQIEQLVRDIGEQGKA